MSGDMQGCRNTHAYGILPHIDFFLRMGFRIVGVVETLITIFTVGRSEPSWDHKNQEIEMMNLNIPVFPCLCLTVIAYICVEFPELSSAIQDHKR